jgi:hypothetical protein
MMLTAREVQAFLRQFEPLQSVVVEEQSKVLIAPNLVRLHGLVSIHGEVHAFETDLNLLEFGGPQDLVKLAGQILKSFEAAQGRGA